MNAKSLSILAIITLIVVVTAVLLTQQPQTPTVIGTNKVFPKLTDLLDKVTEITVSTKDETATLVRNSEGQWQLQEKHNYPVAADKVHKLLIGAAELTILEPKTSNPELYSKLGVEDITAESAQSSLLTLKNAEGDTLASFIVGNDKIAKTDSTLREIYLRKAEDSQAWLTLGQLTIEKEVANWLNAQIIDVNSDRIRKISVTHPDGEQLSIFKETPHDEEFQLADLPPPAKVKFPYMLKNIATTLTNLDLDDVTITDEITFPEDATTRAVFTSFDGLEVTMLTTDKEDKHYAKFTAAFNSDAIWVESQSESEAEKTAETEISLVEDSPEDQSEPNNDTQVEEKKWQSQPADEVKKQVETLNTQFKDWIYVLSDYKVDQLAKKRADLIEAAKESTSDEAKQPLDELIDFKDSDSPTDELGTPTTSVDEPGTPVTSSATPAEEN